MFKYISDFFYGSYCLSLCYFFNYEKFKYSHTVLNKLLSETE